MNARHEEDGSLDSRRDAAEIAVVVGTRPELIKLAPLIHRLRERAIVVHTGQHGGDEMYGRLLAQRPWAREPAFLGVGGHTRAGQVAAAVAGLDAVLRDHRVSAVVVQGDTTSALAGALAANTNDLALVHVEAGLRSYDRRMPEEHNRVVIDHLADLCCAPTEGNRGQLIAEGIAQDRVEVTGNPVVEAVRQALPAPGQRMRTVRSLGVTDGEYILATLHRPENVDDPALLERLLSELAALPVPVVFPVHPRTAARIAENGLHPLASRLKMIAPQSYADFLSLFKLAALIISDSGGVQEEASILKRAVIVVRRSTERPEIEGTFGTLIDPRGGVYETAAAWLADDERRLRLAELPSPYGDGSATDRILGSVDRMLGNEPALP